MDRPDSYKLKSRASRSECQKMEKDSSNGSTLFLWVWNFFANIPQAVNHLYSDIKSGEFLARFTFLDAVLQFCVAIATSCHPQEDITYGDRPDSDEQPVKNDSSKAKKLRGVEVFGGKGRTLRSRTIETN